MPILFIILAIAVRIPFKQIAIATAVFGLAVTITFSPWLIRNATWIHNPVFPEAQGVFGRGHWTKPQTQRWQIANHLPGPSQRSLLGRITAAPNQIFADWRYGYLLIPMGFFVAMYHWRNPHARLILMLLLAWLVFWIAFTHLQSRFFTLAIPVAAMALSLLQSPHQRKLLYAVATISILVGGALIAQTYSEKVAPLADKSILGFEDLSRFLPDDVQSAFTDSGKPIVLIGDAKAFLYQIPTTRLHYRTVFDVDVKPNESIATAWQNGAPANAVKVVDPLELERFSRTYFGITPLPQDFPGPRDHTFILSGANGG